MSLTPISQKAHDISYAVFRVATLFKSKKLRVEIEDAAIALLSHYEEAIEKPLPLRNVNVLDRLDRLVSFAESVGEMKKINADVLKRELNNLQTAIEVHYLELESNSNGKSEDLDISNMFPNSNLTISTASPSGKSPSINSDIRNSTLSHSLEIRNLPAGRQGSKLEIEPARKTSSVAKSEDSFVSNGKEEGISIRQTAILRYIREIQFCRLRNIMEAMPNISERTIRNDIQSLIEKDLVRRVGGGGPNSYFETMEVSIPNRQSSTSTR